MKFIFIAAALASSVTASPSVVHEKRNLVPHKWVAIHRAPSNGLLPVRVGMKQSNVDKLHDHLMDVSDPDSPLYGQHWSAERVKNYFKPSEDTVSTIMEWLHGAGFDKSRMTFPHAGTWVEVNATVAEAEKLLNTEYHVYEHESGQKHTACSSYSVPEHVQPHVELITPTLHFDSRIQRTSPLLDEEEINLRKRVHSKPQSGTGRAIGRPGGGTGPKLAPNWNGKGIKQIIGELKECDRFITLPCLRVLYDVFYPIILSGNKNSYGIVEYTPQSYISTDLDMFFANYSASQVKERPVLDSIDGGSVTDANPSFDLNGESNLDLQYGMGLVGKHQKITLYQAGDAVQGASFNNLLDALDASFCTSGGGDDPTQDGIYPDSAPGGFKGKESCGQFKPANVISTSYGYNEADLTPLYEARQCNEYGKLGLMGTTFLFSSGDYGVAGNSGLCLTADGNMTADGTIFNPSFPSTCPFVTSVGATQVNPNATVFEPESASSQYVFSGGGFSNNFPMPSYQKEAVGSYFKDHKPPYTAAQYNNSMTTRGFPDLSANGLNYVIAINGTFQLIGGTSASSPVVGAILTLVNDARLALGKKPIGFINPTIYSSRFRGAFNDITSGSNEGCGTDGFQAVRGWDPVTGLGTPNFLKLTALWLTLP